MKTYKYPVLSAVIFFSLVSTSYADMFGTDEKKWERVFSDLKKISIRLTDNVDVQLKNLQSSQAEIMRLIEVFKSTIPALQGAIEQNDAKTTQQLSKLENRLAELETRTKSSLADLEGKIRLSLDDQKKSQMETANALKQALATDFENLAKRSLDSMQALSKASNDSLAAINSGFVATNSGFATIDGNNKKMIEILAKTLQENQETGKTVGALSKKVGEANDHINLTRDMLTKLKEIVSANQGAIQVQTDQSSKKIDKLAESLKLLQTDNSALTSSIHQLDEKVSQAMLKNDPINANLDLSNQKLSKLIEILKSFAGEQEKIIKNQQAFAGEQTKIFNNQQAFASEQEKIITNQKSIADSLNEIRAKVDAHPAEPKKPKTSKKATHDKPAQAQESKSKKSASDD